MDKVAVLMSTFNGLKYLSIQIDSILSQEGVEVELYIRDDGSSDNTVELIKEYTQKDKRVHFVPGPPLGVGRSFITLLMMDIQADFFSFSDQDDYWYPDKLYTAVNVLKGNDNECGLYCCNQNCVNYDGTFLFTRFPVNYSLPSLYSEIIKNDIAGCTMVISSALRKVIIDNLPPMDYFIYGLHDGWILSVAIVNGFVSYDKMPHMDFRRNVGNFSDESINNQGGKSIWNIYMSKLKRITKHGHLQKRVVQTKAYYILRFFNNSLMGDQQRDLLLLSNYTLSLKSKYKLLTHDRFWSALRGEKFLYFVKVVFNLL